MDVAWLHFCRARSLDARPYPHVAGTQADKPDEARAMTSPQRQPVDQAAAQQRRFGLLMLLVASAAAVFAHAKSAHPYAVAGLTLAGLAFGALSAWRPSSLRHLLTAWMAFGQLLGRIVSPVVLAILYYLMITPIAVVGRWLGRDELRLRRDRPTSTYWIERESPGPTAESFRQQF